MKIIKYILYGLLAIVAIFLLIAAFATNKVKVERSITINAPKEAVFANISTLHNIQAWSPWAEYDPNMKLEFSGNDGEVGATYSWEGNDKVGKGKETITAISDNKVDLLVEFKEPFESQAQSYMMVEDENGVTKATWAFESETPFPLNAMHVFMDMDKMVGNDFSKGLEKLKKISESASTTSAKSYDIHEMDMDAKTYITKREVIGFADMSKFYATNFPAIMGTITKAKMQPAGAPSSIFYKWDEKEMKADVAAAIPVTNAKAKVDKYKTVNLPAGKVIHLAYYGAYDKIGDAHTAIDKYMKEKGVKNGNVIEEYVTDPMNEKDTAKWLTNIYYYIQ